MAPVLLLHGNIGNHFDPVYYAFMEYCSKNFSKIFVVPGFDELCEDEPFYYRNYNNSRDQLKRIVELFPNTTYLNNETHSLTDTHDIIGITFGSY